MPGVDSAGFQAAHPHDAHPQAYTLSLDSQAAWHVLASSAAGDLVTRMAQIMTLSPQGEARFPKILFTRCTPQCPDCRESISSAYGLEKKVIPGEGWYALDLPYMHLWQHPEVPDTICQSLHWDSCVADMARMKNVLNPVYQQVGEAGGSPLHAVLLQKSGQAVVLAGTGGIGKSTAYGRVTPPWEARCDNETVIVFSRGQYRVHPLPTWSDYYNQKPLAHRDVQDGTPLKAIFFLQQSDKDQACPMKQSQAAMRINHAASEIMVTYKIFSHQDTAGNLKEALFSNACAMAKTIPAYTLAFTRDGDFITAIEKVL